jgi:excisionase family DNA binding protein
MRSLKNSDDDRLTMDIADAAKLLGISPGSTYRAAHIGEIPAIRLGGRMLVLREPFIRMLKGRQMSAA